MAHFLDTWHLSDHLYSRDWAIPSGIVHKTNCSRVIKLHLGSLDNHPWSMCHIMTIILGKQYRYHRMWNAKHRLPMKAYSSLKCKARSSDFDKTSFKQHLRIPITSEWNSVDNLRLCFTRVKGKWISMEHRVGWKSVESRKSCFQFSLFPLSKRHPQFPPSLTLT